MGRRSINTTKSGKYMNPTDQARKEARKRELKKNKKQRMMVRQAVLKGKDPYKLLEDMEQIDKMEYDPTQPPKLNEKVLKDKRKKLKETFDRVFRLYEKEDPSFSIEIKKAESEYYRRRMDMQAHYEQVRLAEQVQLDQIPLPDAPSIQPIPSQIPLPMDIPLGMPLPKVAPPGILKKPHSVKPAMPPQIPLSVLRKRKPPGPPPGLPPPLSDDEEDEENEPEMPDPAPETEKPPPAKQRKIRFEDDDKYDPADDSEKDSRPKFKPAVSPLQVRMLQMAGQVIPMVAVQTDDKNAAAAANSAGATPAVSMEVDQDEVDRLLEDIKAAQETAVPATSTTPAAAATKTTEASQPASTTPGGSTAALPPGAPPGPPPGLPPGPPPGLPPMMFRPPPLRGAPPGGPPRMLPPGPPPGRPPGIPPGPPPGLPPNLRAPPPRLPSGPPGVPLPRLLRPPQVLPPGVPPPGVPTSAASNPNVLSAPPSIMKPPLKSDEDKKKGGATIEAKPQIKNPIGDVTRFMPTALRVKRNQQKGRSGKDDPTSVKPGPAVAPQTKDDAYENFLKEMQGLL